MSIVLLTPPQKLPYRNGRCRAFPYRGCNLFGTSMPHVTRRENSWNTGLKWERFHIVPAMSHIMARQHEPILIQLCISFQQIDVWQLTDKNERRGRMQFIGLGRQFMTDLHCL